MTTQPCPGDLEGLENIYAEDVASAISTLKNRGINFSLGESLEKKISKNFLFDGDDLLFKELGRKCKVYYEYGCGKSTEWMIRSTQAHVFAVDTSFEWISKVRRYAGEFAPDRLNLLHIDVGRLGAWGRPLDYSKRSHFRSYINHFWARAISPDLVLIDGRFRVSCFLMSVRNAERGTKILFDDYVNRPHYHLVEEFVPLVEVCGRQALFEVSKNFNHDSLDNLIDSFAFVMD